MPIEERDLIIHWFFYQGMNDEDDQSVLAVYVADPDGPIPLDPLKGPSWSVGYTRSVFTTDGSGDSPRPGGFSVGLYGSSRTTQAAFPVRADVYSWTNFQTAEYQVKTSTNRMTGEEEPHHRFRSVTFQQVEPPGQDCINAWRLPIGTGTRYGQGVYARPECHPAEWAEWWGKRETLP